MQKQNREYRQFCEENGLKPLQDRLKIAGWDRKQAASAAAITRKELLITKSGAVSTERAATVTVTNPPARVENPVYGCDDVTQKWLDTATPDSHPATEVTEFEQAGVRYKVDGKNIKLEYTPYEKEMAELLKEKLGGEVQLMPKVQGAHKGVSTPDLLFQGDRLDIKTPEEWQKNTLYNAIHNKRKQADCFLLDISVCDAPVDEAIQMIEALYQNPHLGFLRRVFLVKGKEILKIFERKK